MSDKKEVKLLSDEKGEHYSVVSTDGKLHKGTTVIKPVYCGKKCAGCPHKFYKYVVWKQDGKTKWHYIGVIKKEQSCQPTQKTSSAV